MTHLVLFRLCRPRNEEEVNSITDWCFDRFVSDSFFFADVSSFRDPQSEKKLTGGANWTPQVAPTSWGTPGAPMVRRMRLISNRENIQMLMGALCLQAGGAPGAPGVPGAAPAAAMVPPMGAQPGFGMVSSNMLLF